MLKKGLFSIPLFLLYLYIFFMYTAQATLFPTVIHSIVMYGMVGIVFLSILYKKKFINEKFVIWYLVFLLFCFASSSFSLQSDPSILFQILVSLIISFCFIQVINTSDKLISCMKVYVFSALIMGGMLWSTGQLDYLYSDVYEVERLGSEVTGNANIFTALFMYSGVFACWFIIYEDKQIKRVFYLLSFVFILFIMIVSGGRKTIIAIIGAMSIFLIKKGENKRFGILLRNVLLVVLIVVMIFYFILNIPFLYDLIGGRFEGLFNMFSGGSSDVSGDSIRERIFLLALEGWYERPLLGHGIDSFKFYNQSITGHYYYAHNNFVELLYDVGLVGFVLFYSIYMYIYRRLSYVETCDYKYKVLGYGLLVELLIFDMGGVSYYLVGNIIILTLAYLCSVIKK